MKEDRFQSGKILLINSECGASANELGNIPQGGHEHKFDRQVKDEVAALKEEADLDTEDFLALNLPPGYLEQRDQVSLIEATRGCDYVSESLPIPP